MTRYRFLQTVIREAEEPAGPTSYRYDLLAHCFPEDPYFIIRAHRACKPSGRSAVSQDAAVVGPIYARESKLSEVFLDIAHAKEPLHPTHLREIMEDQANAAAVDVDFMQADEELAEYLQYEIDDHRESSQILYRAREQRTPWSQSNNR